MPANGDIYLGVSGSEAIMGAYGRKLIVEDVEISRAERAISGKLRKEIITTKKKITLAYETITGTDLTTYLTLYALEGELVIKIYTSAVAYDQYTVYMQPISRERLILLGTGLWGGVNIVLDEV
jgi:hypothetical protein